MANTYVKQTWNPNDLVTSERLNYMETGIEQNSAHMFELSIPTTSWTLSNGVYTYTAPAVGVTSSSKVNYNVDITNTRILTSDVEITPGTDTLTFSTASIPSDTFQITVWILGTEADIDVADAISGGSYKLYTIPTGQWSGSGSDYYITVTATGVTANSILVPHYDQDSVQYIRGPVWCEPAAGSFTIHTTAIPTDTITVMVQIGGVVGEAQYQVLADVYSKDQAVAKADVVDNLTSTSTTAPLSANQGKALDEAKVNKSDVVNNLTSGGTAVPLSAEMGKTLAGVSGTGYIKLHDGTMIQWGKTDTESVPAGSHKDIGTYFPQQFVATPVVIANVTGGSYTPVTEITGPNITYIANTEATFRIRNQYSSALNVNICWLAIGRWKA